MLIKTKDFDYVDISEKDIITFPLGIYGFEEAKKFVVLKNPVNGWLLHLQSADGTDPRFLLLDPYMFFEDYKPCLPDGSLAIVNAENGDTLSYFAIAIVPDNPENITLNLKSPVVINFKSRTGAQIILENKDYMVNTALPGSDGREGSI